MSTAITSKQLPGAGELDPSLFVFEKIDRCPVCGGRKTLSSYTLVKFGYTFRWEECLDCGVAYQNPRLSQESLAMVYQSDNFWRGSALGDPSLKILGYDEYLSDEEMRMKNERYKINRISRNFLREGRLLDIACGSGTFLRAAHEKGFVVSGVEIGKEMSMHGRNVYGLDITTGDFEKVHCPENEFDIVTIWNADNIFASPSVAWEKIHKGLRTGGYFIFNFLDNRMMNRFFLNIVRTWRDCHSLYIHGNRSIRYLARATGFFEPQFLYQWGYTRFDRVFGVLRHLSSRRHQRLSKQIHRVHAVSNKGFSWPVVFLPMPGYYWVVMRK